MGEHGRPVNNLDLGGLFAEWGVPSMTGCLDRSGGIPLRRPTCYLVAALTRRRARYRNAGPRAGVFLPVHASAADARPGAVFRSYDPGEVLRQFIAFAVVLVNW